MDILTYDAIAPRLSWVDAVEALRAGHRLARPVIRDLFLDSPDGTMLTRSAHLPGLGYGTKSVTVVPENAARGLPSVQGAMLVFDDDAGALRCVIDSRLVTEFKTAADSVLGARILARPDSTHLLIVGAGTVSRSLVQAYGAAFPGLERVSVWARRPEQAQALAAEAGSPLPVRAVTDLQSALANADIVSTATMATAPVLHGDWVRPGTHVDLIGAFRADMREADDTLISTGALFVDSRNTTIDHIGELTIPIAAGIIAKEAVLGDLYDMVGGAPGRETADQVTLFKNGGGAHLDLMMADYIARNA